MKKTLVLLLAVLLIFSALVCFLHIGRSDSPIPVRVLILPKFEIGEITGDDPGEAQLYYERYLTDCDTYEIPGGYEDHLLYVKDGVALYVTGMGKVNAALSLNALLLDSRFDFSDAFVISTGCAGAAYGTSTLGDVVLVSAAVDYDLGHHADARELEDPEGSTWFYAEDYAGASVRMLDSDLIRRCFELVKDVPLETTEMTRQFLRLTFPGEEWVNREPCVLVGTTVTGDNYWKGIYDHENALKITEQYRCPDPFAVTEMEDLALAITMDRAGKLDHYFAIRDSVDLDIFENGFTPESLWSPGAAENLVDEISAETLDLFPVGMENNFKVGSVIVDAILDGTL